MQRSNHILHHRCNLSEQPMKNLSLLSLLCCLLVHSQQVKSQQRIVITPTVICASSEATIQLTQPAIYYPKIVAYYTFHISTRVTIRSNTSVIKYLFDTGGYWPIRADVHFTDSTYMFVDSITLPVYHRPVSNYTSRADRFICNGDTICLNSLSKQNPLQPSNPIHYSFWDWGDATADSMLAPETRGCHHYLYTASFTPVLRVFDTKGCKNDYSASTNRVFDQLPAIPIGFNWIGTPGCFSSPYTFINDSKNYISFLTKFSWYFGDGEQISATAPFTTADRRALDTVSHTYTGNGSFIPKLSLTDSLGCIHSSSYSNETPSLPRNAIIDSSLISSSSPELKPQESIFCTKNGKDAIYFSHSVIEGLQPGTGDFLWSFDDPYSADQNTDSSRFQPSHIFNYPGTYVVSFTIQNQHPSCNIRLSDTILIKGPLARIEDAAANSTIPIDQKFQVHSTDTIDFLNNSLAYKNRKLYFVWDFDDEYAPRCTSYSMPNVGVSLPFYDARQQYANSTHFYRKGGVTYPGKMNCRWSLDSLPRHRYTDWDSVFHWMIIGKTFPSHWDLAPIAANTPLIIPANGIPDPFLLTRGIYANIPAGTILTGPTASLSYSIPGRGSFTYSGSQLLPNSSTTFYEYLFLYGKVRGYKVKLTVSGDTSETILCESTDSIVISHGKPDARGLGIAGKVCHGSFPNTVQFQFGPTTNTSGIKPELGRTVLLINFDSLADRKDKTPCTLDGFIGYQGGITPDGRAFPPFCTKPNFVPSSFWTSSAQNTLYYHYGPNAPSNMPAPADSINGYITIGVIVGTGCANPPECTQALQYSDTIWYHDLLRVENPTTSFSTEQPNSLKSVNEKYTYTPSQTTFSNPVFDKWIWGDQTFTIDSFWYSDEPITNSFFTNGYRRVRYHYSYESGDLRLIDSIQFPLGLPRSPGKFYTDTLSRTKTCSSIDSSYTVLIRDSALMSLPIDHTFKHSSFELSTTPSNPTTTKVIRSTANSNGCINVHIIPQTVGIINTLHPKNASGETDSIFCVNDEVILNSFTRYFRYDNQLTEVPFNPGRSYNQIYDPPYDTLNYDTINFWQQDAHQSGNIERIIFNTQTLKVDTIFYEKVFWDFGDGSGLINGINAKHKYTRGGMYSVKMITRDSIGNYDTAYQKIYISTPKARIGFAQDAFNNPITLFSCGTQVTLFDSSTIVQGYSYIDSIKTNYWWLGEYVTDSSISDRNNTFNIKHVYRQNGLFRVKLVSESFQGCTDTTYTTVFIKGPRPSFKLLSPIAGCTPYTVKILDQTDLSRRFQPPLPNDTPTQSVLYDWGDGTKDYLTNKLDTLTHTYSQSGKYTITAIGSDAPIRELNSCSLVSFPDTLLNEPPVTTKVVDISFDSIIGKTNPLRNETVTYYIPFTPDATYNWRVSGGHLLSGNGTHTLTVEWLTKGIYTLIATKILYGCSHTETLSLSVSSTGIKQSYHQPHFSMYPNPTKESLNIDITAIDENEINITLFDMFGKVCLTDHYTAVSGKHTKSLNIQKLTSGLYFIELSTANGKTMEKLLIE